MRKITFRTTILLSFLTFFHTLFPQQAFAICPVCTVAVGAGLGISRALGIDDAVTSIWIGGLILSMSFWTIDWLGKKKFNFVKKLKADYLELIVIVLMYLLVLVPLWYGKYIGRANNTIFGTDKILFGTAVGSLVFLLGMRLDKIVRKIKGKQLFVYQKVVFPVSGLLLTSLILHIILL